MGKKGLSSAMNAVVRVALEVVQGMQAPIGKVSENKLYDNIEEILNIPYVNRIGVPLALDIFKPTGKEYEGKELPVIVEIHGGGLVTGDRKNVVDCSREFASRGYLVFSIEYRLAPRATVCDEFDDICAGLDFVGQKLVEYDVDFSRMFLTADSAGAFLGLYAAAMKHSEKLQDVIGFKKSRMVFKALGFSCGMFYTHEDDLLGNILSNQLYGNKMNDEEFLKFMNPEHPEIINNLPPVFLVTSRGDFLNKYTIKFFEALKAAGKKAKMLYYAEESLFHTFNFASPRLPQSQDSIDKMLDYFEEQADIQRKAASKEAIYTATDEELEEFYANQEKKYEPEDLSAFISLFKDQSYRNIEMFKTIKDVLALSAKEKKERDDDEEAGPAGMSEEAQIQLMKLIGILFDSYEIDHYFEQES